MKYLTALLILPAIFLLPGCQSEPSQPPAQSEKLTVGTVQKEIRIGMSGADVVSVLGSPNMVTTDDKHRETWVYDKVATESVSRSSNGWVFALIAGGRSSSASSSTTQRTLTIIIKFDENGKVRDFAYHSSQF
jgi:outer membrane protein assembly factor BamE (lipoprotein component of BamABCDE complex)